MTHSTITTAQLTINRTGYGQYQFVVDTPDARYTMHSTNSELVDAINSDDDENDWGSRQNAIDKAIESVLDHANVDLTADDLTCVCNEANKLMNAPIFDIVDGRIMNIDNRSEGNDITMTYNIGKFTLTTTGVTEVYHTRTAAIQGLIDMYDQD